MRLNAMVIYHKLPMKDGWAFIADLTNLTHL